MFQYRLQPAPGQAAALLEHCVHTRYVWNLAVEQESWWRSGRGKMPGLTEHCRQLTDARADNLWLAAGSVIVQQQALKDHAQAMADFFVGTYQLRRTPLRQRSAKTRRLRAVIAAGPRAGDAA